MHCCPGAFEEEVCKKNVILFAALTPDQVRGCPTDLLWRPRCCAPPPTPVRRAAQVVVGYCMAKCAAVCVSVVKLAVVEEWRRRGLARRLLQARSRGTRVHVLMPQPCR